VRTSRSVGSVLVVGFAAVAVLATPAQATFSGGNGPIAFATSRADRFSGFSIRTIHRNGTHEDLVARPGSGASYSPDGTRLAWSDGDRILVRDLATGNDTVAFRRAWVRRMRSLWAGPSFSADGTRLAFGGFFLRGDVRSKAYTVATDGTDLQRLPISLPRYGSMDCLDWGSNDEIAFSASGYNKVFAKLFTIAPDGSGQALVATIETQQKQNASRSVDISPCPSWSPDATKLAFASNGGQLRSDVWIVDADGSNLHRMSRTRQNWELSPIWSPSGDLIALARAGKSISDQFDLLIVAPDGALVRQLTSTAKRNEYPASWRPRK
jgi:Tol biopolymer transport system component